MTTMGAKTMKHKASIVPALLSRFRPESGPDSLANQVFGVVAGCWLDNYSLSFLCKWGS